MYRFVSGDHAFHPQNRPHTYHPPTHHETHHVAARPAQARTSEHVTKPEIHRAEPHRDTVHISEAARHLAAQPHMVEHQVPTSEHVHTAQHEEPAHAETAHRVTEDAAGGLVGTKEGIRKTRVKLDKHVNGRFSNARLKDGSKALHDKLAKHLGEKDMARYEKLKNQHYSEWIDNPEDKQLVEKAAKWMDKHAPVKGGTVVQKIIAESDTAAFKGKGGNFTGIKGYIGVADQWSDIHSKKDAWESAGLKFEKYGPEGKTVDGVVRTKLSLADAKTIHPARATGIHGYHHVGDITDPEPYGGTGAINNHETVRLRQELHTKDNANVLLNRKSELHKFVQDEHGHNRLKLTGRWNATAGWQPIRQDAKNALKALESPAARKIERYAGKLGVAGGVMDLAVSFHEDGNKVGQHTIQSAASVAGGWAGAEFGAEVGATVGSFAGPVGTVVGGVVGGIVGGIAGSEAGHVIAAHAHAAYKEAGRAISHETRHLGQAASREAKHVQHTVSLEAHYVEHAVSHATARMEHALDNEPRYVERTVSHEVKYLERTAANAVHAAESWLGSLFG